MDRIISNDIVNSLPDIITLREHQRFEEVHIDLLDKLNIDFCITGYECAPKYLGIDPNTLQTSYYIGAEWITDKNAIVVTPKIANLDFIEMFVCALKFEPVANYFSKFYSIDFNSKPIKTNVFNNQITPLIVIHFIAMLKKITKRGLKKAYVLRNENIKSKIKGKINISQHIKQNVIQKREDRVYCQYQEYTVDNLENRILKKALIYTETYINSLYTHKSFATLISTVNNIKTYFTEVSDNVELHELKSIVNNKIYKEYSEAIRIAKMILRKFNYSISETKVNVDFTPAFWIDMSRLYEVYVYSKLHARYGDDILFQVPGYGHTAVDFVDKERKIVIDTKYKPQYNYHNGGVIDDVRQISAYARDKKILKVMNCNIFNIVKCLIIYPEDMTDKPKEEDGELFVNLSSLNDFDTFHDKNCNIVNGYEEFYKISIPMPKIN